MRKRTMLFAPLLAALIALTACGTRASQASDPAEPSGSGSVEPYALSEEGQFLLHAFQMDGSASILSVQVPEGARSLSITFYQRKEDGTRQVLQSSGQNDAGGEAASFPDTGTITLEKQEDGGVDCHLLLGSLVSFSIDGPAAGLNGMTAKAAAFLEGPQEAALETEVPLAVFVYDDGTQLPAFGTESFFDPSIFDGMALVQAVTLKFSGQSL